MPRRAVNRRYRVRPDAPVNARPKVKYLHTHGGASAFLRDPLDMRTRVGRAHHALKTQYRADLGGDLTVAEEQLVDQAARLALLANVAWTELVCRGTFNGDGETAPALDAFLRTTAQQRQALAMLGIERQAKKVPALSDYIEGRYGGTDDH